VLKVLVELILERKRECWIPLRSDFQLFSVVYQYLHFFLFLLVVIDLSIEDHERGLSVMGSEPFSFGCQYFRLLSLSGPDSSRSSCISSRSSSTLNFKSSKVTILLLSVNFVFLNEDTVSLAQTPTLILRYEKSRW
jgi:hypothetical protein